MHQYEKDYQEMQAWMDQASKEEIDARASIILRELREVLCGINTEDQIINLQPALNLLLTRHFGGDGTDYFITPRPVLTTLHGTTLFGVPVVVNRIHNLQQMPETLQ